MRTTELCAFLLSIAAMVPHVDSEVLGKCVPLDSGHLRIQLIHDDDPDVTGIQGIGSGASKTCKSTVDGNGKHVLTIEVDENRVQVNPNPDTDPCHLDTILPEDQTKVYVLVKEYTLDGFFKDTEKAYSMYCTFGESTGILVIDPVQIDFEPDTIIAATNEDGVSGMITAEDGSSIEVPQAIGTPVLIVLKFDRSTDEGVPLGISVVTLEVDIDQAFGNPIPLITDRCIVETLPEADAFSLTTNFETDQAPAADIVQFVISLGITLPYIMDESAVQIQTLYFRVTYEIMCSLTDNTVCYDVQAYCDAPAPGRRKKRSASEGQNATGTVQYQVGVRLFENGQSSAVGGADNGRMGKTEEQCIIAYNFWIVALVLGILLLLVIFMAIFLFYRIRREQGKQERYIENAGTQNIAYTK